MSREIVVVSEPQAHELKNIEIQQSQLANTLFILCFPCCCSAIGWCLGPREEAITLNCGVLTGTYHTAGVHCSNPVAREIRVVKTAERTLHIAQAKITDFKGNPILVSAIVR